MSEYDGPNDRWHFDGYDKLEPYHFWIHGCVDGYSRKVIWLEMTTSTLHKAIPLHFYLKAIVKAGGLPRSTQSGRGTENVSIATAQIYGIGDDGHLYGGSKRMGSMWRQLRQGALDYWIDIMDDLYEIGDYNPDNEDEVACAHFVFGPLIERDLEDWKDVWNSHRIRRDNKSGFMGGAPNILYMDTGFYGAIDCKQEIPDGFIDVVVDELEPEQPDNSLSDEFETRAKLVLLKAGFDFPITKANMIDAFIILKNWMASFDDI